jgi:hypothetical protein
MFFKLNVSLATSVPLHGSLVQELVYSNWTLDNDQETRFLTVVGSKFV